MLNLIQHLISRANQTLKLSQRLMGLRPKVEGDAIWAFEIASNDFRSQQNPLSHLWRQSLLDRETTFH